MERRIFLATKGEDTVGVNFNVTNNEPKKLHVVCNNENQELRGREGTKLSALYALTQVIKDINVEELTAVVMVYVNNDLYEFLQNESYKNWIVTGVKKTTGKQVTEREMQIIKDFYEIWKEKGLYFVIKDLFKCKINDSVMKDESKIAKFNLFSRQNNIYCRYAWSEVEKISGTKINSKIASVI